ncbi:TlpA family protein disulfide reductase [Gorillibacterium massiliense]|uniref:TlpA family protein disulfide reductase n=1 Tax=Gorillibacterium massiliense TaxID=1280390 RepID=UPI0004B61191|nr:TlpA disulfide reductase family protein [Gorillibacterium massiliense]
MKKNIVIAIVVLVLVTVTIYQFQHKKVKSAAEAQVETVGDDQETISSLAPKIGKSAPAFALTALDGKVYEVGGKRSKPLMLNFWASWCGPCEEEAPELAAVYDKYKERLDMYAVNMTATDEEQNVKAFVKQYGFRFPVLLDKKGEAGGLYKIIGIPTSYLIGVDGTITAVFNVLDSGDLDKKLQSFLKEQEEKRS